MPQGMEPDVRKYLFKVLNSLCYGLLWMALNVLGGLYWGYASINGKLSVGNILFFCLVYLKSSRTPLFLLSHLVHKDSFGEEMISCYDRQ